MILVSKNDFIGYQSLAKSLANNPILDNYIDRYEKLFIYKILGVDLGKLFIADLVPSTITLVSQGNWDASGGTLPTAADTNPVVADILEGFYWTITVAGTINSVDYLVGDLIYATADTPSSSDWAKKEIRFTNIQNAFTYQTDSNNWFGYEWSMFWGYYYVTDGIYNSYGMVDVLTSLIYYEYVIGTQVKQAQVGTVLNLSETGEVQSPLNAARAGEVKWNDALNSIGAIQWYCSIYLPDIYTEYKGVKFNPVYAAIF